MSTMGKLQAKLAEILQINEAMVTHIESLAAERDYFKNGMAELQDIIDKLEPERDVLVAQVEVLREQLKISHDCITCADETGYLQDVGFVDLEAVALELKLAIESTPQQCLREIQAEAGRAGFVAGYDAGHEYRFSNLGDELADEYAEKVRNGK